MVNTEFKKLIKELKKFSGKDIIISTIGAFNGIIGMENCIITNSINKRQFINIINSDCISESGLPVSIVIDEDLVLNYEIIEVDGNSEVRVRLDGEDLIIVGC